MRTGPGLATVALLLVVAVPSGLDSCAIAPPAAVFVARERPADRDSFLKGRVPVLQRSYSGEDLIAAFRMLAGKPLSEAEVASLYSNEPMAAAGPEAAVFARRWLEIRRSVPGAATMERLDPYRTSMKEGYAQSYLNCQSDAFVRAIETLVHLMTLWGVEDARTREWLKAQDEVFANCAGEPARIPAEPSKSVDALLAAHRRYQIAAANFYAGRFGEARERFRRIGQERESPWRDVAPYLEARSLLRAGLVNGDQRAFAEGKVVLQSVLEDKTRSEWHAPSLKLMHLWQTRAEPRRRLIELGQALAEARDEDVTQEAADFLYLLAPHRTKIESMAGVEGSELAAWIVAVSMNPGDAAKESMRWWRKKRSAVWLVAALLNAEESDSEELVRAARSVGRDSPAYESAGYFGIEREMRRGHQREAREWADRMLGGRLTRSTRNEVLARRMELAQNWNEFLKFAPRRPETEIVEYDGAEVPAHGEPVPAGPYLMQDGQRVLNLWAPLRLWLNAARNPLTPWRLQARMAYSGWLRAVMLERYSEAREFLRRAIELQPEGGAAAKEFLEARDHEAARFAAVRLVLRAPSICPSAPYPGLEGTNLAAKRRMLLHGGYRSSCWVEPEAPGASVPNGALTTQERTEGRRESAQVYGQPAWTATVLLREAVDWALKHPEDARIPETLHDAVMSARYRRTDEGTGTYSKKAFDLLHRRYKDSPWAARTPYWYK